MASTCRVESHCHFTATFVNRVWPQHRLRRASHNASASGRQWCGEKSRIRPKCSSMRVSDTPGQLIGLVKLVRSGDPENVEARAARYYWSQLFENFTRANENDRRNSLLNYGYAVVRAAVARALVAHGLLPSIGVGHASVTNAFNLADDLQEPFRPFVDRLARRVFAEDELRDAPLTVEDRQVMAGVLLETAGMGEESITLLVATEKAAASLARAITEKCIDALVLPRPT